MDIKELKRGDRIKLAAPLENPDTDTQIKIESIPVGTLGTVTEPWSPGGLSPIVSVNWDNGRRLGILDHDSVERVEA
jgi:hypothetical protein